MKIYEGNKQIDCIHRIYEILDGNEQGDFENIIFSYANIADCKIAEKLAEVVRGGQYLRMQGIYRKKMF